MIRSRRESRGLSLRALGVLAGIGFNTIRDIERGDIGRPTPETLRLLGLALDIPYRDLALAAYGANGHTPPESEVPRARERGDKAKA